MFALIHMFARIFYFRTGSDAFSQKSERIVVKVFFPIALSYTPVAAMCFNQSINQSFYLVMQVINAANSPRCFFGEFDSV